MYIQHINNYFSSNARLSVYFHLISCGYFSSLELKEVRDYHNIAITKLVMVKNAWIY